MKEQMKIIKGRISFCLCVVMAVCLCVVLLIAQSVGIATKDAKAKEALDAAVKVIGVAGKIGEIKSLVIRGASISQQVKSIDTEIRILLPDSFVEIQHIAKSLDSSQRMPSYRGVSQGTLIPPISTALNPYAFDGRKLSTEEIESFSKGLTNRINYNTSKAIDDWSRFLIGTLMKSGSTPITISSGAMPGIFSLTKKDGELGEIEFDPKTGYPSVIRYKNPESNGRMLVPNSEGAVVMFFSSNIDTSKIKPDMSAETNTTDAGSSMDMGAKYNLRIADFPSTA